MFDVYVNDKSSNNTWKVSSPRFLLVLVLRKYMQYPLSATLVPSVVNRIFLAGFFSSSFLCMTVMFLFVWNLRLLILSSSSSFTSSGWK